MLIFVIKANLRLRADSRDLKVIQSCTFVDAGFDLPTFVVR